MLHLHAPPSLRRLSQPRVVPGPGGRHVGLEYDLAAAVRPGLVVDLGAADGASFFAYCQAMHDHGVDGLAYAIDSWAKPPAHPDAELEAVRAHARQRFPGFSYVVQMPPPDARRHFSEESIDLLCVDASRPDVLSGADVEAWFRRVKPGGVLVWHGASDAAGLWSLVAGRCRTAVFSGGRNGLGIAAKPGPEPSPALLELLFTPEELPTLEAFYTHLHEHLEMERTLSRLEAQQAKRA